ncbi:MAG: acyltransferase family protein [Acidimicrobiales bacterium]
MTTTSRPIERGFHPGAEPVLSDPRSGRFERFSALDGIRAFAVLAVIAYHAGIPWTGGGLLGVDVFFVLSGFLITSLLCRELTRSGTVRLGRFWAQRARRLLPALFITILGVAGYCYVFRHSLDLTSIRGDAIATLLYVANWHFIVSDQGYFTLSAAPSPLLHTWSLAVEEQYYLVWPLVALFVVRRWSTRALARTAAVGALASAVLSVSLYAAGFSINRIYYGTDTRAQALLVGSFLGAVGAHATDRFSIVPARWVSTARSRLVWTIPGLVGAVGLGWAWHAVGGQDPFLYEGGFLLVALAAGAVILTCVTVPRSSLARFLSLTPLVFIGRISYGLYLYHWPLFLAIDHAHTGLSGIRLLGARLAATFAVAVVSFRFVEEPIRTGTWFRGLRGSLTVLVAVVVAVAAVVGATIVPPVAGAVDLSAAGTPAAEHAALQATGAFGTRPIRFLLLGDSVGLTLGLGLQVQSVTHYGVRLYNGAVIGCDLDQVDTIVAGVIGPPTPECAHWRTQWRSGVARIRPDVVGLLLGRWEVSDHYYRGQWMHVGEKPWDTHLVAELDQAVSIFTSRGAKVVLFTLPYSDPSDEQPNGSPFPENLPSRTNAWNALVDQVAASHPRTVTIVNLNKLLGPHGVYQQVVDGVTVRWADGIHISRAGGEWLQPKVLPTVARLGLEARSQMASRSGSGH